MSIPKKIPGLLLIATVLLTGTLSGCKKPASTAEKKNESIIGRKTQAVGEFDPEAGRTVSDSSIDEKKLATPIVGPMAAYGPIVEQISKLKIQQAISLFQAEHGRFPKDHAEFMSRIIRPDEGDGIQLPVLPGGAEYQYDVENHELVVVKKEGKK